MTVTRWAPLAAVMALSACSGSKTATERSSFEPPPLPEVGGVNAAAIDATERSILSSAREASGVRDLLAPAADDTFRLLGEARAAAQGEAALQLEPAAAVSAVSSSARMLVALGVNARTAQEAAASWVEVPMMILMTSGLQAEIARAAGASPGGSPADLPAIVTDSTQGGVTSHLEYRPKITGSKVEGTIESTTTTTTPGGTTVTERITAALSGDVCPDPQGIVPLRMTIRTSSSAGTRGYDYGIDITATGQVGDDGVLAGYGMDLLADFRLAPGNKIQGDGMFVEFATNEAVTFSGGGTGGTSTFGYRQTRTSSKVDLKYNTETTRELITWARLYVIFALKQHEAVWLKGHCVEVLVPARQRVAPDSERSFTAKVRHRFEGTDLSVPVIASLETGAVSVAPANTKVQAPATFVYVAPGERDLEAKVKVVTRSRRGGAEAIATFVTGVSGYRAIGGQGDSTYSGVICSLESPFEIIVTSGPGGATFSFTPSSASAGTMTESGSFPGGIVWTGSGTYTVEGLDTSTPRIVAPFSHTTTVPDFSFTEEATALIDLTALEDDSCVTP